jgi:hypothetical protein
VTLTGTLVKIPRDHRFKGWQCPNCGEIFPVRRDECPKCGVIVEKLFRKDLREGLNAEDLMIKYGLGEAQLAEWKRNVPRKDLEARRELLKKKVQEPPDVVDSNAVVPSPLDAAHKSQPARSFAVRFALRILLLSVIGIVGGGLVSFLVITQHSGKGVPLREPVDETEAEQPAAYTVSPPSPESTTEADSLKLGRPSTRKITSEVEAIARNYRKTHTYSMDDLFVCVEMSIDVWNQLITHGIKSYLRAGTIKDNLKDFSKFSPEYYGRIDHVWVMFQSETGEDLPVEVTGGHVVNKTNPYFLRYLEGIDFENPKRLRNHMEVRGKMAEACKEAKRMAENYNSLYAGKPRTQKSLLEKGKVDQKLIDCKKFTEEFNASLR